MRSKNQRGGKRRAPAKRAKGGIVKLFKARRGSIGQVLITSSLLLLFSVLGLGLADYNFSNITGMFLAESSAKTISIEVWADSSLMLLKDGSSVKVQLLLDDGMPLVDREISFYANDELLGSSYTNSDGIAEFSLISVVGTVLRASFQGDPASFINPSEATEPLSEDLNQTIFTVHADKSSYSANETIHLSGDTVVEGILLTEEMNLIIEFNNSTVFSTKINSTDGRYSHSLKAIFENEGEYTVRAFLRDLEASAAFFYSISAGNITKEITAENETLSIDASIHVESIDKKLKSVAIDGTVSYNSTGVESEVDVVVKDTKGDIVYSNRTSASGGFSFDFTFAPESFGKYTAEITASTEYGTANKTVEFDVLKHKVVKPKISHSKQNYGTDERIIFNVEAIDMDDGSLFQNATLQAFVTDPQGNTTEVSITEGKNKGQYVVEMDPGREFIPGLHKLKVRLTYISPNPGEVVVEEEVTFTVGLININTDKSIYLPNENATITVGVLDEVGKKVVDADLTLTITSPSGKTTMQSTKNGLVENNGDGTYTSYYKTGEAGEYTIYALAEATNVSADYTTHFETRNFVEFDIRRDMPTIIDIGNELDAKIKITAEMDATGVTVVEKVPNDFLGIT